MHECGCGFSGVLLSTLARRMPKSDFARNGFLVLGSILFGNAFNYVYFLLMGRALSVLEYGAVMSLLSAVMVVVGIGSIAQTVAAKLAADLRAAGDAERTASFAQAMSRAALFMATAIILLVFASKTLVASYLHLDGVGLVTVAGVAAGFGFALMLQRGLFQGFEAFSSFGISSILDGIRAALILPLAHAFGAIGSVIAMVAASAATTLYGELALRNMFGKRRKGANLDLRRMLITARATGLSSFGVVILMFYDVVLARHYLSPIGAGLYGAAALAGRVIFTAISFLPTILLPRITLRQSTGRSSVSIIAKAFAIGVAIISLMAAVCGNASQLVIRILAGPNFSAAAPLLFPYALAAGALAMANLLSIYAIARHRFGFVRYLLAITACEITLVTVRHASPEQVVQNVLVGHIFTLVVMLTWVAFDLKKAEPARMAVPKVEGYS
jgi:O-antigen/teichoic acid export membrane protein